MLTVSENERVRFSGLSLKTMMPTMRHGKTMSTVAFNTNKISERC